MSIDLRDDHFLSDSQEKMIVYIHILAVKFNERLSFLSVADGLSGSYRRR